MTEVRTRDEAIASVDQALQAWSVDVTGVLTQAQATVQAAQARVDEAVRRASNQVAAIQALLAPAPDDERARQLRAKLTRAQQDCDTARRASVRVNDVAQSVSQLNRTHTTTSTPQVASARAELAAMSRALEGYRSSGTFSAGGGSKSRTATHTGGDPFAAMGLSNVEVDSADLDSTPILDDDQAQGTFGKGGLSRADYRWAVQTWNDTVGPGVAGGKSRDDFAQRDAQSSAKPLRRTADVYDMFLGTDRIRADRQPDGSLDIVNGRHRLLIARELGIKNLPGQVSQ